MKKIEFLNAVKGHTITVKFIAQEPCENGKPEFEGLPKTLTSIHPNQLLAWLKAWIPFKLKLNDECSYWNQQVDKLRKYEDETGFPNSDIDTALDWLDWCERHPTMIFQA